MTCGTVQERKHKGVYTQAVPSAASRDGDLQPLKRLPGDGRLALLLLPRFVGVESEAHGGASSVTGEPGVCLLAQK